MPERPSRPSEVFARRLRAHRQRRGWTQGRLAEELAAIGWTVDRGQISRIEKSDRGLTLDESIVLAWALGLPPALLYLPLGEADEVAIAPDVAVHPDQARKWVAGIEPATDSSQRARMVSDWGNDMKVWRLHERLGMAQSAYYGAKRAVASAEYVGDPEDLKAARVDKRNALQDLYEVLQELRTNGLRPPAIHETTVEEMRKADIIYDGPSYPGPGMTAEKGGKR